MQILVTIILKKKELMMKSAKMMGIQIRTRMKKMKTTTVVKN
jgi:hypothetical protein